MYQFKNNINVFCLDELHSGGNKYYKLKYNVREARKLGAKRFLSFGGAWSNHIHALALLGHSEGLETIGVIRGERPSTLSATLLDAMDAGMQLHFISRQTYRSISEPALLAELRAKFGEFYVLPEGGTNDLAVQGASEIISDLRQAQPLFDKVILPIATGGTLAGIAKALRDNESVIGISVLKGNVEMQMKTEQIVSHLLASEPGIDPGTSQCANQVDKPGANWAIDHRFHCGGYAKCPPYLRDFILETEQALGYPLEPVYSAKMLWAISQMLATGEIMANERVVAIHTGGLQGRRGFPWLAK
jgi:1-aminocyclopropane-1-carboxylate deaminase